MIDLAVPEPTINHQITDSITQIIRYKEGLGIGFIKTIHIAFCEPMSFDDAILKYSNQKELHVPSFKEFNIICQYMKHVLKDTNYLTTKTTDEDNVIVLNNFYSVGTYRVVSKKEKNDIILVLIEYN